MNIALHFFTGHAIEGRPCNVDIVVFDECWHMAVEESEQKGPDVRTVDVRIRHDDDFVVAELAQIEIVTANPATKGGNHRPHFSVLQNLLQTGFFHV